MKSLPQLFEKKEIPHQVKAGTVAVTHEVLVWMLAYGFCCTFRM